VQRPLEHDVCQPLGRCVCGEVQRPMLLLLVMLLVVVLLAGPQLACAACSS
jgi:hypothetical protein